MKKTLTWPAAVAAPSATTTLFRVGQSRHPTCPCGGKDGDGRRSKHGAVKEKSGLGEEQPKEWRPGRGEPGRAEMLSEQMAGRCGGGGGEERGDRGVCGLTSLMQCP